MYGSQLLSMDSKGRISMPTKYRDALTTFVMVPNPIPDEPCLLLYTLAEWQKVLDQVNALPSSADNRKVRRRLVGSSENMVLDSNGRFLIKPEFREKAHLDKKIKWIADGKKIELWDEATYETVNSGDDEGYLDAIESLSF